MQIFFLGTFHTLFKKESFLVNQKTNFIFYSINTLNEIRLNLTTVSINFQPWLSQNYKFMDLIHSIALKRSNRPPPTIDDVLPLLLLWFHDLEQVPVHVLLPHGGVRVCLQVRVVRGGVVGVGVWGVGGTPKVRGGRVRRHRRRGAVDHLRRVARAVQASGRRGIRV